MKKKAKLSSKKRTKKSLKQINFLDFVDSDADGLSDNEEKRLGTDPFNPDTDRDGLPDFAEVKKYRTDPLNPDTDNDGITDGDEVKIGLNPKSPNQWKDIFWPSVDNNYQPLLLRPKRAIGYSAFFVGIKAIAFIFAAALPLQAFMMPDVLAQQRDKILALVEQVRAEQGAGELAGNEKLRASAQAKASDMVNYQYFSHVGPEQHDLPYFLKQADYNYRFAGENLAMGFNDASSVVRAWVKSPLHYQNIIDKDFAETGMGIDGGEYQGRQTVFIANHFGSPLVTTAKKEQPAAGQKTKNKTVKSRQVLGEKLSGEAVPASEISYQGEKSFVLWKYDGERTTFTARAVIGGEVAQAVVYIGDYQMELKADESEASLYAGTLTVAEPIDNFFQVVINPSIIIKAKNGATLTASIPWYQTKIVAPSLLTRYQAMHTILPGSLTRVLSASRVIFALAIIIFSVVLLLTIFIEIKKQHPHIIVQTLAVIGLLAVLISI
ncbi:hypothetical protein COU00_02740 [Candidatus Falkowbacteria bacterium CG10_big_fil_rev_8_21_14_0_10_43_11]|uniref:SCP domain-containing protein n=1 Tax=Candidatus Falkowbacteria bacterium CG10_big_fil_rev_8_21_14_0_10_43_11 TaxID=1974568 RepID=A0A2M6WLR0_9BACT|nr:MAG: hypothetical protein COU00_02740 [Candidatus Falkowbacteria bacterium CG10_big_fil_rev_8_21_14_0_10_43_11]